MIGNPNNDFLQSHSGYLVFAQDAEHPKLFKFIGKNYPMAESILPLTASSKWMNRSGTYYLLVINNNNRIYEIEIKNKMIKRIKAAPTPSMIFCEMDSYYTKYTFLDSEGNVLDNNTTYQTLNKV